MRAKALVAVAASVALVAACGDSEPSRESTRTTRSTPAPKPALEAPYLGPLTFAWGSGCSVPVSERVTKGGNTAVLEYHLGIEDQGTNLLISFEGMRLRSLGGKAPTEGEARSVAAFRLPSFEVSPQGSIERVVGMDQLVDEVTALDPGTEDMFTPEFVAILEDTVATKYWDSWVGFWAEYQPIDEERFETVVATDLPDTAYETRVVVESLGTTADGDAVLRQQQDLDGEDFLRAVGAVTATMTDQEIAAALEGGSGHRTTTVDVTTDPKTLRPRIVRLQLDVALTRRAKTTREAETREWTFDWSRSGCTPP